MSKDNQIVIRVEPELKKKLQELAKKDRRTLSDYIRIQLENLVEKK